ncbi:HNH endonuclease [Rhizobiales bacterium GAS113]|nr:HNH endonuclease [Rhizobiales bacterium GAS113]
MNWKQIARNGLFADKSPDQVKSSAWRQKQDQREKAKAARRARAAPSKPPKSFYRTEAWLKVRYQALKLHGGACQCCGARPTKGHPLHVDHIKPRSRFPQLALSLANLQVLCEPCNMGKSNRDDTDWRSL